MGGPVVCQAFAALVEVCLEPGKQVHVAGTDPSKLEFERKASFELPAEEG